MRLSCWSYKLKKVQRQIQKASKAVVLLLSWSKSLVPTWIPAEWRGTETGPAETDGKGGGAEEAFATTCYQITVLIPKH